MKNVLAIRKIATSLAAIAILTWAFPKNQLFGKALICPFLICAIAYLGENIFLLFNQEKIAGIFQYIFRFGFFAYAFGFLAFAFYYSLVNKEYSLIPLVLIFTVFTLFFLRGAFFRKK